MPHCPHHSRPQQHYVPRHERGARHQACRPVPQHQGVARRRQARGGQAAPPPPLRKHVEVEKEEEQAGGQQGFRGIGECSEEDDEGEEENLGLREEERGGEDRSGDGGREIIGGLLRATWESDTGGAHTLEHKKEEELQCTLCFVCTAARNPCRGSRMRRSVHCSIPCSAAQDVL